MNNAQKMVKSFAGFSVVPIVSGLITIFVVPFVSHVFPEDEYGKINMFYSIGMLMMNFCMLGLDSSLIRYYFEPPKGLSRKSLRSIALIVGLLIDALLFAVTLLFFANQASHLLFGEENVVLILCLCVFVASLIVFRLVNIDARMDGKVVQYNIQGILQNVITKISFVAVGLLVTIHHDASIIAMTVMMVMVSFVMLVAQSADFSFRGSQMTGKSLCVIFTFGLPAMATSFVLYLNGMVGKVVLSSAGMFNDVGVFAISTTISNIFTIIPTAFMNYWSPFMYENYSTKQDTIKRVHDLVMWGSAVITAGIIMFQSALFLIVGGGYSTCQAYFMLVMINPIQTLICETTGYGISLKEKPIYNALFSALGVIVSIFVTCALMPQHGAFAAALGVLSASVVVGVLRTVVGQHFYRSMGHPRKTIVASILILAACFLNTFICDSVLLQVCVGVFLLIVSTLLYKKEVIQFVGALRS